jgi:hypothetical protein
MSARKACCPNCYRQVSVTSKGYIRRHKSLAGHDCGGSGKDAAGNETR